jgi:hypothetical protein
MKHTLVAEAFRQPDDNRIILKLARECNFCKEDDDIYGEVVNIIHPDISPDIAAKLGVPSLTETLLEDAERLVKHQPSLPLVTPLLCLKYLR